MKVISRRTDYAVRALVYLAGEKSSFFSSRAIAGALGIPFPFLRNIVSKLIRKKILSAQEGRSGGVRLLKRPSEISVMSLINLFQDGLLFSECLFRKDICPNKGGCLLRRRLEAAQKKIDREFSRLTINDLVKDRSRKERRK